MFLRATAGGRSTPDNHRRAHHSVESDDDGAEGWQRENQSLPYQRLMDMNPSIHHHSSVLRGMGKGTCMIGREYDWLSLDEMK